MFRRKLLALDYYRADNLDVTKEDDFRSLVIWTEDQKIRHYKIEDRGPLRDLDNPKWEVAFDKYWSDVGFPINWKEMERTQIVDMLLGYALRLEYGDNVDKFKAVTPEAAKEAAVAKPILNTGNPLDNLDPNSEDFRKGLITVAQTLEIPLHDDPLILASAIAKTVKAKLSKEVLLPKEDKSPSPQPQQLSVGGRKKIVGSSISATSGSAFPYESSDLGFETGDAALDNACRILRLLHIKDLRDLQTKINEIIVAVQIHTADPKTDQRLGVVGRS